MENNVLTAADQAVLDLIAKHNREHPHKTLQFTGFKAGQDNPYLCGQVFGLKDYGFSRIWANPDQMRNLGYVRGEAIKAITEQFNNAVKAEQAHKAEEAKKAEAKKAAEAKAHPPAPKPQAPAPVHLTVSPAPKPLVPPAHQPPPFDPQYAHVAGDKK